MAALPAKILAYLRHDNIYSDHVPGEDLKARPANILACLDELALDGKVQVRDAISRGGGTCRVYEILNE